MRVRLLGTAAGGGFPQWNCGCRNCRGVRTGELVASPRTQSCVAVSSDGFKWFLINASPDIRMQVESFAPLGPGSAARGTGIAGILLTSADLDHTLGLLMLREGDRLVAHAFASVRQVVTEAAGFANILDHYCGMQWREPSGELSDLRDDAGEPSGLQYMAFSVPGKPPRYAARLKPSSGDAIGYRIVDSVTGGSVVCAPGVAAFDAATMRNLNACDLLLLDGTFWCEDEMALAGVGTTRASDMGHWPVGGPDGSLARIATLAARQKIYLHINNTNRMLVEDSPERRAVESAGVMVGEDGMEFQI